MKGVIRVPPGHSDVRQGSIEEAEAVLGRRRIDEHDSGISGLQEIFGDGVDI